MDPSHEGEIASELTRLRADAVRHHFRSFLRFGNMLLAATAVILLLSNGMPLQWAGSVLGPVLALSAAYFLIRTALHGGIALQTWIIGKQKTRDYPERPNARR